MSWYAIDAVEDALDVTRGFLLPFDLRRWLTLAVMVFFLGGASGAGSGASNGATSTGQIGPTTLPGGIELTEGELVNLAILVVAVVVTLALVFALIGSIMRFVFVDALRTHEARIRGRFGGRAGKGFRLFLFQLVIFLIILAPVAVALISVLFGGLSVAFALLAIPFALLFGLVGGLAILATNEFVVPVMIAEDVGVLDGWRRFWPTLRAEWKQFGVYLLVRFVLGIAVGFVAGIVTGVVAVPLAVLAAVAFFGPLSSVATTVLVVVAVPLVLLFLVLALLVQVPLQTYLTYFALLVLGDANEAFDLIPTYRAAARGV